MARSRESLSCSIIKQGYLKKVPNANKIVSTFKKPVLRWFVFGVIRGNEPYLEYYENEESIFTNPPINTIFLSKVLRVQRNTDLKKQGTSFSIFLPDRILTLAAANRHSMIDWSAAIEQKLVSLRVLTKKEKENIYSSLPKPPKRQLKLPKRPPPPLPESDEELQSSVKEEKSEEPSLLSPDFLRIEGVSTVEGAGVNSEESKVEGEENLQEENREEEYREKEEIEEQAQEANDFDDSDSDEDDKEEIDWNHNFLFRRPPGRPQTVLVDRPGTLPLNRPISFQIEVPNTLPPYRPLSVQVNATNSLPAYRPQSIQVNSVNIDPRHSTEVMQNMANGQITEDFLRLDSISSDTNSRQTNRRLFPDDPEQEGNVYENLLGQNGALRSQGASAAGAGAGAAPPIPARTNIPNSPASHPSITRQDSRPLTFVSGQARTPDGNNQHSGPMRVGSRTPMTGLPPLVSDFTSPGNPGGQGEEAGMEPPSPLSISVYPESPRTPQTPLAGFGASPRTPAPEVVASDSERGAVPENMEKMIEALGLQDEDSGVFGWNAPPPEDFNAPPAYQPRGVLNRGRDKSLKLSQVEQLQKEMSHAGGVKVVLRRVDCLYTVAWVNAFNAVWVGGWIQQKRPFLHTAFHIGDQVISVNGQVVENARMVHKLVKHCSEEDKITFILKRVPHGRVYALKREEEGQGLGIHREGGTGEIISVDQFGVAGTHGLPSKAPTIDGTNLCNWHLTEINSRSINLFFKDNEIEKRLNAVGKEISILVQPLEFVQEIKKQLKLNYKNYKDFLVQ